MTTTNPRLNHYVDLDTYPIHALDTPEGQELVARAHQMMKRDTLVAFPGFLRRNAVCELAAELQALETKAHQIDYQSTAYGWRNNSGFAADHPRSALFRRNCGLISTEMLDDAGASQELYRFAELTEFVRRMLGYDTLHRTACPTLSIQVNAMRQGHGFGWHFDTNDGVVSFIVQCADEGGEFEYVPLVRDEDNENYDKIARIFRGKDDVRRPQMTPGTLSLFLGRRSVHRVAPVGQTSQSRISLLYSYDREAGMVFPKKTCERITSSSPEPYLGALTT